MSSTGTRRMSASGCGRSRRMRRRCVTWSAPGSAGGLTQSLNQQEWEYVDADGIRVPNHDILIEGRW
jgi:hypothetical protein